jgi:hypothetical protein
MRSVIDNVKQEMYLAKYRLFTVKVIDVNKRKVDILIITQTLTFTSFEHLYKRFNLLFTTLFVD